MPKVLNSDGRTSEADIERLKQALAGRIPIEKTSMDVNGDGVVNSRDLIDLIRSARAGAPESQAGGRRSTALSGAFGVIPR